VLSQGYELEINLRVFNFTDDLLTEESFAFKDIKVFFRLLCLCETEAEVPCKRRETMSEEFS
jgi:hypothetical protein